MRKKKPSDLELMKGCIDKIRVNKRNYKNVDFSGHIPKVTWKPKYPEFISKVNFNIKKVKERDFIPITTGAQNSIWNSPQSSSVTFPSTLVGSYIGSRAARTETQAVM